MENTVLVVSEPAVQNKNDPQSWVSVKVANYYLSQTDKDEDSIFPVLEKVPDSAGVSPDLQMLPESRNQLDKDLPISIWISQTISHLEKKSAARCGINLRKRALWG